MKLLAGKRPSYLGVTDGKLARVPNKPNCVSSQAPDGSHKIEPFPFTSSGDEALGKIKSVIQNMDKTEIITNEKNYLYAEFTSGLMGFVDDVEFYCDESAKTVHIRSASRLGHSDLGANRKRVEAIRAQVGSL